MMNENNLTLLQAVKQQKKDMFRSLWKIQNNFNISTFEDLDFYCLENGLIRIEQENSWNDIEFKFEKQKYFELVKDIPIYQTGTISSDGKIKNFGIFEKGVSLYGKKITDIEMFKLTFDKDQTIDNDQEQNWGFYNYYDDKIENIQSRYGLMSICQMGGAKQAEEYGRGFAVKLKVEKVQDKFITNWWNNLTDMKRIENVKLVLDLNVDGQEIRKNISFDEIKRIFNYCFIHY